MIARRAHAGYNYYITTLINFRYFLLHNEFYYYLQPIFVRVRSNLFVLNISLISLKTYVECIISNAYFNPFRGSIHFTAYLFSNYSRSLFDLFNESSFLPMNQSWWIVKGLISNTKIRHVFENDGTSWHVFHVPFLPTDQ